MSTKIENVVYRASWRDEISANVESVTFSTATPDCNSYRKIAKRGRYNSHNSFRNSNPTPKRVSIVPICLKPQAI